MFLLILFSMFTIALIVLIVYKMATGDLHGKDWPIFPILAFFIFMIFVSYSIYKKGVLSYLVDDYGFTFEGEKDNVDKYTKDNIVLTYKNSNFYNITSVHERINKDMNTKFHYEFLNKKYKFNNSLNIIYEYLTSELDTSKEIIFYGDHNHINIGYNHKEEKFYYEVVVEYKEYSYYKGSGDAKERVVEKNPNYDKYKDYKVIFINYDENDMPFYDRIASNVLGEKNEPRKENLDLIYLKY